MDSQTVQCNGGTDNADSQFYTSPILGVGRTYCPQINSGCGIGFLGSKGHINTIHFDNALCLFNFYDPATAIQLYGGVSFDPTSTTWAPLDPVNLYVDYTFQEGKVGCLSDFAVKILQKQFDGSQANVNFEKQGVAVYRNGVQIYNQTQPILASNVNGTPMTFNFTGSNFCTDGSTEVTFRIYFGLVHQFQRSDFTAKMTGYDDISIRGTCEGPNGVGIATAPTCIQGLPQSTGSITLSGFGTTDHYDFNIGSTYTGGKTYATASAVPGGGVIVNNLPDPTNATQAYTVRLFNATGCYSDIKVYLKKAVCPPFCANPTGVVTTPTAPTCSGTTPQNNGQIAITGVSNGTKVGISMGGVYTGPSYTDAGIQTLSGGAYTFTSLANPVGGSQLYTVRVFNGNNSCYIDNVVELVGGECGVCKKSKSEIWTSDIGDPDSTPGNDVAGEDDQAIAEFCLGTQHVDLALTKTVSPATGTVCGSSGGGTTFTWTITLTNTGDVAATGITVADLIPAGLQLVSSSPSTGNFYGNLGWLVNSLPAGGSATLTITTKALKAGTYKNVVEVMEYAPISDPDSSPGNFVTTEDDYAEATITVTGASPPIIEKEFSSMLTKPGTPTRLTLKITNNESTPITLTENFVDTFPTSPGAMVVANNTTITTVGMAIPVDGGLPPVATVGGNTLTLPKGTVLVPGLNQISLEVTVPSEGSYCNTIAAGSLKTTVGENCLAATGCLLANTTFNLAPRVKKTMTPATIQTGQNATLTITIENLNGSAMTLNQDFVDYLPTNLVATGTPTSTCGGVSLQNSDTELKIAGGTTIAANSTCTIVVSVKSTSPGTYCNVIPMNAVLTTVGTNNNLGNEDIAEACVTVTNTPCTAVGTLTVTQDPATTIVPGSNVTLTAVATGFGATSFVQWSGVDGSFSNVGINPTVWTAPATEGTYTIKTVVNNSATGYGTCKDSTTTTITVAFPCTPPTPTGVPAALCGAGTVTLSASGCDATYPALWYSDAALTTQVGTGNSFTTPSLTTTTTYYVACVKDATCQSAGVSVVATINALPTASAVATAATCNAAGTAANADGGLTLSGFDAADHYDYTVGATYTGSATYASATAIPAGGLIVSNLANPAAATTYTIRVFNAAGCFVDLQAVLQPTICTPNCTPPTPIGVAANRCGTGTVTLTATGCDATYPAVWFSDAALATQVGTGNSFTTPSLTTTTTYYVSCVKDATCKSAGVAVEATINALPTASAVATAATCNAAGTAANADGGLTLSGFDAAAHYDYTVGVTYTGSATYASATAIPAGGLIVSNLANPAAATTYTIRVFNAAGCFIDVQATLQPTTCTPNCTPPTPIGVAANRCGTGTVTLTATGCDATYPAVWFSDAALTTQVGTGNSFTTPAITATTTYYVACVKDATCKSAGVSVVATVNALPILSLSASSTSVTVGTPVSLSAIGCTGSVVWSTGATTSVISVIPTNATTVYSATCTTGPGCTATASITLNTAPAASLVVVSATVCYGSSATLVASGCTGSVSWNTGATGTTLVTPVLTASTSYTATCTTGTGSTTTAVGTVTVMPQASLSLSASSTSVTVGTPVSLSAIGCTGSVVWSTGATTSVISVIPTNATTVYSATCTTGPGCTATASITLNTTAACSVSLTTNSLPVGTVGQAYSANLTVSGGTAPYSFLLAGGTLPTGLTLSSTGLISGIPTATGTFSTTIRITDSQSCSVTVPLAVLNIELAPTCSLTVTATPGSCQSATNTYSVSGTLSLTNNTNGGTILLSDGTQLISLSIASGVSSVPYSLTGLVSDGLVHTLTATLSGCGTASVSYTAPQSCTAACQPPVHACKGTNYAFVLTTTPGLGTYQWYRNGNAISGATASSFTATQAGSYSVVVNGNVVGQCPDGSCCPVVIVEDEVPLYQANVQTATCR
ncbi:Ig-like domain-containing protein, partial [Spirosoma migulaei]